MLMTYPMARDPVPTTEGVTANRGSRAKCLKDGIGVDADTAKALPKRTRVLMLDLAT